MGFNSGFEGLINTMVMSHLKINSEISRRQHRKWTGTSTIKPKTFPGTDSDICREKKHLTFKNKRKAIFFPMHPHFRKNNTVWKDLRLWLLVPLVRICRWIKIQWIGEMKLTGETRITLRKTYPSTNLSHRNRIWIQLGWKPSLRSGGPLTNPHRHDTVFKD